MVCAVRSHVVSFTAFSATPSMKSTKSVGRYLVHRLSERDEIWQTDIGGLLYMTAKTGELWLIGGPLRTKILKGVKYFVTLFS